MPGTDPAVLQVRGLDAFYGSRQILHGIDLDVRPGEIRAILGGSGGGKTTLLKHLVGLSTPTAGTVTLLGVDLAAADEAQRTAVRGRIGMLFQGGALLNALTLLDNVALPLRERTSLPDALVREMAAMKLMQVGLGHALWQRPPELSGGMRKRAALARAMALDPELLFCDEPSAGLDPVMAADLDQLLLRLRDDFGTAIVIITHELASIAAVAERVTMLARGRVIADGPHDAVSRSDDPEVRSFFARQAHPPGHVGRSVHAALTS